MRSLFALSLLALTIIFAGLSARTQEVVRTIHVDGISEN